MENDFIISLVIPCYNEATNIKPLYFEIEKYIEKYPNHEIIFVDDGSNDNSLEVIKSLSIADSNVKYLSLSRNFGHQNALKAGYDFSNGDCVISLDCDLQHPPQMIDMLVDKWKEGYEVVYTVRKDNSNLSFFKKITSKLFYKIINKLTKTEIKEGAADFRLLDKNVIKVIRKFEESHLFLRGIIAWIGFKQISIEFYPNPRYSGNTKYSIRKMVTFAFTGITSFSIHPLKMSIYLGFIISFSAFAYGLFALIASIFTDKTMPGWTSVIVSVLFIGGIQLIILGILGEYIGKLFIENKKRPNYIIKEKNA